MKCFFWILGMVVSLSSWGTGIKIGVFAGEPIQSAVFTPVNGSYQVLSGSLEWGVLTDWTSVTISISEGKIKIGMPGGSVWCGTEVKLIAQDLNSEFRLNPNVKGLSFRQYYDNLIVKLRGGKLVFINEINLDRYVSGVVEAETGAQNSKEFYKVQAIISRTYALANKHKHEAEGFHLCDKVHCQVYHGKAQYNDDILFAAYETRDLVLVDSDINLITAAFHSNCGGQTIGSEKVWSKSLPYLQSVPDTFCLNMSQSRWEKTIDKKEWVDYLALKNIDFDVMEDGLLADISGHKAEQFQGDEVLRFSDVRRDFNLRSAWFVIRDEGEKMRIEGRGFGHGVGLCQEGAIRRAEMGQSYEEILFHYYIGVHLINLHQLEFFRD